MDKIFKIVVLIFGGVLVLIFIVFILVYKYCGEMKVLMYIYFNWYLFDWVDDLDLRKIYDVFVLFSGSDY